MRECNCVQVYGVSSGETLLKCVHVDGERIALIYSGLGYHVQQVDAEGSGTVKGDKYSRWKEDALRLFEQSEAELLGRAE